MCTVYKRRISLLLILDSFKSPLWACWSRLTLLLYVSEPDPVLGPPGQHHLHLRLLLRGQELGEVAAQPPAVLGEH